jgi:hypothetical protein
MASLSVQEHDRRRFWLDATAHSADKAPDLHEARPRRKVIDPAEAVSLLDIRCRSSLLCGYKDLPLAQSQDSIRKGDRTRKILRFCGSFLGSSGSAAETAW